MKNSTETLAIIEALKTVANFVGEDTREFTQSMLARKNSNLDAIFAAAGVEVTETPEGTSESNSLSLRTEGARTEFDSRVRGMLSSSYPNECTAASLMQRYTLRTGSECTSAQMRASLNRLIESSEVTYTGIQRGTKYSRA